MEGNEKIIYCLLLFVPAFKVLNISSASHASSFTYLTWLGAGEWSLPSCQFDAPLLLALLIHIPTTALGATGMKRLGR